MGNAVSNIGLMPLLLENAHATALLNNPEIGQGSCWTSESKLDSCADNGLAVLCNSERDTVAVAQLIWQEQVCEMIGGSSLFRCGLWVSGRVVECFWMASCNHCCWNCITWCLLFCEDKTCLPGAGYVWCLCVHVRVCFDCVLVLCNGLCVPVWKNST